MRKIYLLIITLMLTTIIHAQLKEYKKEVAKADGFLTVQNYVEAAGIYDDLLEKYSDDTFIQFKAAECFLFSENRVKESIALLDEVVKKYPIEDKKSIEAIEARFYLGQAYHLNYEFEKALEVFEDLKKQMPLKRSETLERIDLEMQFSLNAIELKKNPLEFKISNLGPLINTEYDEHSPVINLDEDLLLYTSNRETEASFQNKAEFREENVYYSLWREGRWITSRAIDLNSGANNATIGISPDGATLLIYQNDGSVGNIYTSKLKNDKWGELEKLPAPINTLANETHASFSMDGKTLFFSSDRNGGYGGKDIYKVKQLPNGEWGKVQNLGPEVNTSFDEESPYIHPTKNTLYFSSEGHMSIGGFDIFKAGLQEDGTWGNVENIGYPVNTPFDDLFYAPTIDEQRVYYASRRDEGFGGTDIYLIEFAEDHPNALTVVGGFLFTEEGDPAIGARVTITNTASGDQEGVYKPSPSNGKYIFILPEDQTYKMEINDENHKTVITTFTVPAGNAFARKGYTFYLDPIVLQKDNK
ncbi:hypothetical protein E9993_07800 [Labilibacter sediminis]|nr:hypothetical protein E9993_07800 [Labilibacter sediminis]